jgi:hypothetical protein
VTYSPTEHVARLLGSQLCSPVHSEDFIHTWGHPVNFHVIFLFTKVLIGDAFKPLNQHLSETKSDSSTTSWVLHIFVSVASSANKRMELQYVHHCLQQ